jgi:TPR repeat protein
MYYNGDDVPQDKAKGYKWLRKAAEQGHEKAQENIENL